MQLIKSNKKYKVFKFDEEFKYSKEVSYLILPKGIKHFGFGDIMKILKEVDDECGFCVFYPYDYELPKTLYKMNGFGMEFSVITLENWKKLIYVELMKLKDSDLEC
ncbi:MAG: hypothetical protein ACRC7R_01700 [Sarcina sp.]